MALAKTTQDHDEIRKWAEARGGKPAVVSATESKDETGIIRLMFPKAPHHNDGALEEISWDEWFEKFDDSGLELTYQEKTADGKISDFNKLTYPDPDSAEGKKLLKKSAGKKSAKKAAAKGASDVKSAANAPEEPEETPAKAASKKSAPETAHKKSSPATPERNYPKPDHKGPTQVY